MGNVWQWCCPMKGYGESPMFAVSLQGLPFCEFEGGVLWGKGRMREWAKEVASCSCVEENYGGLSARRLVCKGFKGSDGYRVLGGQWTVR